MNNGFDLTTEELNILIGSAKRAVREEVEYIGQVEDFESIEAGARDILTRIELLKKLEATQDNIGESHDEEIFAEETEEEA